MSVEKYDIVSILGNSIDSCTYKVQHKETKEILVWKTVNCENINDKQNKIIVDQINKRKDINHAHILKFYEVIEQKECKILYIVTEFIEKGSLKNLMNCCLMKNICLSEELICKILYQLAFTMKTIESYDGKVKTNEIFLDEHFNVKLLNFSLNLENDSSKELKMCSLGLTIYELCILKNYDKYTYENEIKKANELYSNDLLSLLLQMIKDTGELKKNINKILCHPVILVKFSRWTKEKSFYKINILEKELVFKTNQDEKSIYASKLEKLRDKENILKIKEQKMKEMEHKLAVRERKIALMERNVKEKIQQAELYLKRCQEAKSKSSVSSKSRNTLQLDKKTTFENLDSTYVSCGDSVILSTTAKLNINKIVKPAPFTRTLSERRVRFKGHSPLKEINFNKKKIARVPKDAKGNLSKKTDSSEWSSYIEDEKSNVIETIRNEGRFRELFPTRKFYEIEDLKSDVKPETWTEENKKYAFSLLRLFNTGKENNPTEIKHTYL